MELAGAQLIADDAAASRGLISDVEAINSVEDVEAARHADRRERRTTEEDDDHSSLDGMDWKERSSEQQGEAVTPKSPQYSRRRASSLDFRPNDTAQVIQDKRRRYWRRAAVNLFFIASWQVA